MLNNLHICDTCTLLATNGVTDAYETVYGWRESVQRFGCDVHPVQPMIFPLDGRRLTVAEWEATQ